MKTVKMTTAGHSRAQQGTAGHSRAQQGTAGHSKERFVWLDIAKGIGITLVVLGHIIFGSDLPGAQTARGVLTLYQMPLFFILSGYLFKAKPDMDFMKHKALTLLLPYFTYILIMFCFIQFMALIHHNFDLKAAVVGFVKAMHGGRHLIGYMGTAWFLSTLFFAQIAYNFIVQRVHYGWTLMALMMASGSLAMAIAIVFPQFHLPFGMTIAPLAMLFFAVGHYLRQFEVPKGMVSVLAGFVIAVCLGAAFMGVAFKMDMKYSIFGPALLGTALALSLSWFVMHFYQWTGRFVFMQHSFGQLGKASLVILCLHQFVHLHLRDWGMSNEALLLIISIGVPYAVYLLARRNVWSSRILLGQGWR